MNQSNMLISNMNQSNASVDMTMYHSVALLAVFCPPPVRKRSKRGFLPLGQLLLVQYEKPPFGSFCSNIIYRGNIGNCPGLHSIRHFPSFGGQRNRRFWNPIWVRSYGTEPNFYTFDIRIEIRFDERIYVYNFIGFMYRLELSVFLNQTCILSDWVAYQLSTVLFCLEWINYKRLGCIEV